MVESVSPPGLSVVVMAFNEVESLEGVIRELRAAVEPLGVRTEILIIDDGSTDGTSEGADRLAAEGRGTRVIHHPRNGGLGAVYRTGFAAATGELLTFFPADGQFPASILETFLVAMDGHDLVLGYVSRRDSPLGRVLSVTERAVYRLLLGPLPRFQGVFMVRRDVLARTRLLSEGRGWAIVMELLVRATRAGWRVRSVPTPFRPRQAGTSKVQNARTIWSNLRQVVALRRRLGGKAGGLTVL